MKYRPSNQNDPTSWHRILDIHGTTNPRGSWRRDKRAIRPSSIARRQKTSKTFRTWSIFSSVAAIRAQGGNVGQDVPARFTMGTTTALSRQAVINGAVIKPAKHEADGFRWLEGWPSRCFGKTTPVFRPRRTTRLHFSTLSSRRPSTADPHPRAPTKYLLFSVLTPALPIHFSVRLKTRAKCFE